MTCLSRFVNPGVLVITLLPICLGAQSNQGEQTAKIFSVRTVLRNQYFVSRYPQTHYFLIHISLGISDQKYCTEYETPVLDEIADVSSGRGNELIALDEALESLAELDPRKARIIELRFFGGLSVEETAAVLKVSPDTVMRDWRLARSWLLLELSGQR